MHEDSKPGRSSDALSLAGILIISLVFLFAVFQQLTPKSSLDGYERVFRNIVLGYLGFMTLRTIVLVLLSFADRFFNHFRNSSSSRPLVSILVPCFNEEVVVQKAIASILTLDYPNLEILVIDDGSTDLTLVRAQVMESDRRVRVIYQKNQGKAEALNRGIQEAQGEYVLCVDADSLLLPDVITQGLPYFDRDPRVAAVAGSVRVGNSQGILAKFQRLEYIVGLNFHKTAQSFLGAVMIVPGPVGLFRRSAILSVGGYRSDTFAEDCDLTIRLLMRGYRTVYSPGMVAITEAPEDFTSLLKQRYRWSRGTFQAIKINSYWLTRPFTNFRNFTILTVFLIETLVIPCMNFLLAILFIHHAIEGEGIVMLGPFFAQLTLLDLVLTSYSVVFERSVGTLVFLSVINRTTYGLAMEVLRFFSVIDEIFGLPMNWNKLERKGL